MDNESACIAEDIVYTEATEEKKAAPRRVIIIFCLSVGSIWSRKWPTNESYFQAKWILGIYYASDRVDANNLIGIIPSMFFSSSSVIILDINHSPQRFGLFISTRINLNGNKRNRQNMRLEKTKISRLLALLYSEGFFPSDLFLYDLCVYVFFWSYLICFCRHIAQYCFREHLTIHVYL